MILVDGINIPRYLDGELYTNFQMEFSNGTIYNFNSVNVNYSNNTNGYHYELVTPKGFGNGLFKISITNSSGSLATLKLIGQSQFTYQLPTINNITLVSPRFGGQVTISGNGFFESLVSLNVLGIQYPCTNIVENESGNQLTCEFGQVLNVIDADYYSLQLVSGRMINTTFDRFSFLPWNKVCPNQCSGNGECDSQLNCICNENYESFDCSIKVNSNQVYTKSNLTSSTTFKMLSPIGLSSSSSPKDINGQEEFSITISSFRRLNYYGYLVNQYPIEMLTNLQQEFTDVNFTVSGSPPVKNDMFESFEFDGDFYLNSDESPESFINEHGYDLTLPTSRNSAIVNLLATGITLNDYDTDSFQFVFAISSSITSNLNASIDFNNQVISITSNISNSILQFTPYYYSFSLSKNLSQEIDRSPIKSTILSDQDAQSIYGYKKDTIYIAIETKPQYEMLMVDASFNLYKNSNQLPNNNNNSNHNLLLKVLLPVGFTFLIVGLVGLTIFLIKRRKRLNNNNNNNNNQESSKSLLNSIYQDFEEQDI